MSRFDEAYDAAISSFCEAKKEEKIKGFSKVPTQKDIGTLEKQMTALGTEIADVGAAGEVPRADFEAMGKKWKELSSKVSAAKRLRRIYDDYAGRLEEAEQELTRLKGVAAKLNSSPTSRQLGPDNKRFSISELETEYIPMLKGWLKKISKGTVPYEKPIIY